MTAAATFQGRARSFVSRVSSSRAVASDLLEAVASPDQSTMATDTQTSAPEGSAAASMGERNARFNEGVVREFCDEFKDEMKGQTGRDLLKDFKDMHKSSPRFGAESDEDAGSCVISARILSYLSCNRTHY